MRAEPIASAIVRFDALLADEALFEAWYRRTFPRLYAYVLARTGHRHDIAEDITQLVFVEAVRRPIGIEAADDGLPWLIGIARHKLADAYRRLEREERRQVKLIARSPGVAPGPDAVDTRASVESALAAMPPAQRLVLMSVFVSPCRRSRQSTCSSRFVQPSSSSVMAICGWKTVVPYLLGSRAHSSSGVPQSRVAPAGSDGLGSGDGLGFGDGLGLGVELTLGDGDADTAAASVDGTGPPEEQAATANARHVASDVRPIGRVPIPATETIPVLIIEPPLTAVPSSMHRPERPNHAPDVEGPAGILGRITPPTEWSLLRPEALAGPPHACTIGYRRPLSWRSIPVTETMPLDARVIATDDERYNASLVRRDDQHESLATFWVRFDGDPTPIIPGQYMTIGVFVDGKIIQRPYSIASSPSTAGTDGYEMYVRLVEGGAFTPILWQLPVGHRMRMIGPKGRFTLEPDDDRIHLFISSGTGNAPFIAMMRWLIEQGSPRRAVFLNGCSYVADIGYRPLLEEWEGSGTYPVTFIPTISRPAAPQNNGWTGRTGRVETIVAPVCDKLGLTPANTIAYICGNPDMIVTAEEILLGRGFAPEQVKKELYWPKGKEPRGSGES